MSVFNPIVHIFLTGRGVIMRMKIICREDSMIKKHVLLIGSVILLIVFLLGGCSGSEQSDVGNAPVFSSGYPAETVLDTRIYMEVMLNKNGTVYSVAVPQGDPAPTPEQVKMGQNSAGFTLMNEQANTTVTANVPVTFTMSGFSYNTDYDIYYIAEDSASNMQETVTLKSVVISERDTIFVSKDGDDGSTGTIYSPKQTIGAGITAVTALGSAEKKVRVSAGTYNESVSLADGISLYGGYSASSWGDRNIVDRENVLYSTSIMGPVTQNGGVYFTGTYVGDWILEGFTIETSHPDNSYGVRINIDGTATVRYNTIYGGTGQNESDGIYINGSLSRTVIEYNIIDGGASTVSSSRGILVETTAVTNINGNTILGGNGVNGAFGIQITYPHGPDTSIANNTIHGGTSNYTRGIHMINYDVTTVSNPRIIGNHIEGGTGNETWGIQVYGSGAGRILEPYICNNVIRAGNGSTGAYAIYIHSAGGTPEIVNNTIDGGSIAAAYSCGIYMLGVAGQETNCLIINNIIVNGVYSMVEFDANSLSVEIRNNDLYGSSFLLRSNSFNYASITILNGLRTDISDNISLDPSLDPIDWSLTSSTNLSVRQGGLDLSGEADFPEDSSGNKIDKAGSVRNVPWSVGAFELN